MKVLIDTNVVLDVLLARAPWVTEAQAVWDAHHSGQIGGYVAATALTNLYYIARRLADKSVALESVRRCLATFDVISVDRSILDGAMTLNGPDFEDNVMIRCAVAGGMDAIVTRDLADFVDGPIPVLSPRQLVERLEQGA